MSESERGERDVREHEDRHGDALPETAADIRVAQQEEENGSSRRKWLLVGLGILAVGVVGFILMRLLRPAPPESAAPPQAPLVRTAPADVRQGRLRVVGNGTVTARAEVGLSPQVAGRAVYVNPKLVSGGEVAQGEVLLRIDPSDYRNRVEQAQAQVAQRRVDLMRARQEQAIAEDELRRLQRLEATGGDGIPYETDFQADGGAGTSANNGSPSLDTTEVSPLTLRRPQREAAEAALRSAEAQLADARLALDRTTLVAPFSGRIRSEQVDVGQYIAPGQEVARIYSDDAVEVVVPLSDDDAALIPGLWQLDAGAADTRIGAVVSTDYGGQRFSWQGYVDRAQASVDPATRTIDVVVRVPRPFQPGVPVYEEEAGNEPLVGRPPLLVGMYTTVEIDGEYVDRYVAVPRAALRPDGRVWTVRQDSLLRTENVDVIQEVDEQVYLFAPAIDAGLPVVTSDIDVVTDGMPVRVADSPAREGGRAQQ